MNFLFIACAAIGSTIMVIQFVMTLIGFGDHGLDADAGPDLSFDHGGDFHGDAGHTDAGHTDAGHGDQAGHHGSTWLFGVLSFRTLVAAMAFFGLAGLAAESAEAPTHYTLLIAVGAGAAAMFGVYHLMRLISRLRSEGTVRIARAVGERGTVYLKIPPAGQGTGKVQLNLQNRTMEYCAQSAGPEIATGTPVEVTAVLNEEMLEVRPV